MDPGTSRKGALKEENYKLESKESYNYIKKIGARWYSGWPLGAVRVDRRFEFLDSTVWTNVFNAVTEGSFVK